MDGSLSPHIKRIALIVRVLSLLLLPADAVGWTSARLTRVDVVVEVAGSGPSKVETAARFDVSGGKFHGFDLAPMPGGQLVPELCSATLDDGLRYPLSIRKLHDGRTRVVLGEKAYSGKGGVNFSLVHEVDLVEQGALRRYAGRARLDWTPLVWDEGTDQMSVTVFLPGDSRDAPVIPDPSVSADYEVEVRDDGVTLTKYRTVRWYPMQVVIEFDPELVFGPIPELEEELDLTEPVAAVSRAAPTIGPPPHVSLLPVIVVLLGLLMMVIKSWRVGRVLADLGFPLRFRLLPRTGPGLRLLLTFGAAGLGLAAQYLGSLAAGVPALGIAAALWLMRREEGSLRPRPGGVWRLMDSADLARYQDLVRAYRRRRRCIVDITTPIGITLFVAAVAGLGCIVFSTREAWPQIAWATLINGAIWIIPAWFSHVRSELPVDPTIECFSALKRWRRGLARLVGRQSPGSQATFWTREDERGAIEVRLRVDPPPAGLRGLEVAGEVVRSGTTTRTRRAVILKLEPGTDNSRRLATCPHAAEHHLTPDLEEEVIVLRDRRTASDSGLGPLRVALSMLNA
jgi:hypothetical protein